MKRTDFWGKGWDNYDPVSAEGLVVIGVIQPITQGRTKRDKHTLFWWARNPPKKTAKIVQSRRLYENKKGTEVREKMKGRGVGGSRGNLLQVKWSFGTNRNPIFLAAKPKTKGQKR